MPRKPTDRKYPALETMAVLLLMLGSMYIGLVILVFAGTSMLQVQLSPRLSELDIPMFWQDVLFIAHYLLMIPCMIPAIFIFASAGFIYLALDVAKDVEYIAMEVGA